MLKYLIIIFAICLVSFVVHKYLSFGFILAVVASALIITLPVITYLAFGNIDYFKLVTPFGDVENKYAVVTLLSILAFIITALLSSGVGWLLSFQNK